MLFYSIFYSFCKVVLYNFFEYHDHSEYESASWFDDDELMISWMKMKKFKRSKQRSSSLYLSLKTRNVLASHLLAFFAIDSSSRVSALAVSAARVQFSHSYIIFDQRSVFLSLYMRNLTSSTQHHKTALNVYSKEVVIQLLNRCKKCVKRNVDCVKIKFSIEKNFKKCALCVVIETNCKYES